MPKKIKLIFGLGNPEKEYENTRHNFGKDLISKYIDKPLETQNAVYGKFGKIFIGYGNVFMNESGKAIGELQKKLKLKPEEIMIVHDEADLPLLWLKFSFGKKSAGHKGVESARKVLKSWNFWRLRIGIQGKKRKPAMDIILKKLREDELKLFNKSKKQFEKILQKLCETTPDKLNIPQKMLIE
ncbi:MAG: aminoacyl-tRNA hydrolase [Patescibacteria group bacterium]